MKKIYLLLLSALPFLSTAQTIDQGDLPFAGLGWTSGVDSNYSAAIPPGGTGQTWDYSNLQYDYVDTSGFRTSVGTPYAGLFPNANLAALRASTNEWSYFITNSSGFYINGFVNDTASFVLDPPQMYVPVPFSYGNTHTNISRVEIDTVFIGVPAKIILHFQADFLADGSGTLITPTSTYPSVLRVRETMLETDSIMVDYLSTGNYTLLGTQQHQQTYYRWFTHGGTANYILGIDADSLGTTAVRSDYIMQWAVLGTEEFSTQSLELYPDPASSHLTINCGNKSVLSLEVFNVTGEKVYTLQPFQHQSELVIDVAHWVPGSYFYRATTTDGNLSGRFTVIQ